MKKNGKAYAAVRVAFSAVLSCMLVFSMVGCKDTDVLTQLIIDQSAPVDNSLQPITDNDATSPLQENWADKQYNSENDKRQAEDSDNTPKYDSQTPSESQAQQKSQSDLASNDGKATEGSGEAAQGSENGSGTTAAIDGSTAEEENSNKSNSYVQKADTNDSSTGGNSGTDNISGDDPSSYNGDGSGQGNGGTGQVYGSDGSYANLPYASSIAAAGEYATIVQMLGGKNALAAADSEWLSRMRSKGAFSTNGDELANVQVAWSGNGRASGSADVSAIVASGAKVVLTCDETYGGITQDQANALMEKGISVVVMPAVGTAFAGDDEIVQSVQIVGEILSKAGSSIQYNAKDAANKYKSFRTETINNVVSANGGYTYKTVHGGVAGILDQKLYTGRVTWETNGPSNVSQNLFVTAYVDSWAECESGWSNGIYIDGTKGIGLSANARWVNPRGYFAVYSYYLQCAGVAETAGDAYPFATDSLLTGPLELSQQAGYFCISTASGLHVETLYMQFAESNYQSSYAILGESDMFPAILARNSDIAIRIKNSAETPQVISSLGDYEQVTPYNYAECLLCPYEGSSDRFLKPYQIWVVPSGIAGSWTDGTVESFLMAPWAYCMYQRGQQLNECSAYVSSFYSTFFRCDPTAIEGYGETYVANCHS